MVPRQVPAAFLPQDRSARIEARLFLRENSAVGFSCFASVDAVLVPSLCAIVFTQEGARSGEVEGADDAPRISLL